MKYNVEEGILGSYFEQEHELKKINASTDERCKRSALTFVSNWQGNHGDKCNSIDHKRVTKYRTNVIVTK
jgi:hypothetical protein